MIRDLLWARFLSSRISRQCRHILVQFCKRLHDV